MGGFIAATGIVIIPIIAIIVFTIFYNKLSELSIMQNVLNGITVCVCSLTINSLINLWKKAIINKTTLILFVVSVLLYLFTKISIIIIIISMGLINFIIEKYVLPKIFVKGGEKS